MGRRQGGKGKGKGSRQKQSKWHGMDGWAGPTCGYVCAQPILPSTSPTSHTNFNPSYTRPIMSTSPAWPFSPPLPACLRITYESRSGLGDGQDVRIEPPKRTRIYRLHADVGVPDPGPQTPAASLGKRSAVAVGAWNELANVKRVSINPALGKASLKTPTGVSF